jgi:hypothetical protein
MAVHEHVALDTHDPLRQQQVRTSGRERAENQPQNDGESPHEPLPPEPDLAAPSRPVKPHAVEERRTAAATPCSALLSQNVSFSWTWRVVAQDAV